MLISYIIRHVATIDGQIKFSKALHDNMVDSLCACSYNKDTATKSMGNFLTLFGGDYDTLNIVYFSYYGMNCMYVVKLVLNMTYCCAISYSQLLIPLCLLGLVYTFGSKFNTYSNACNAGYSKSYQKINNFISSIIEGSRTIWGTNSVNKYYSKSVSLQNEYLHLVYDYNSFKFVAETSIELLFLIWNVIIILLASHTNYITIGVTTYILRTISKLSAYITSLVISYPDLSWASLAHKRCLSLVNINKDKFTISDLVTLPDFSIAFKQATVGYEDTKILENVDLQIPFESSIAIVGRTGSGKTTIGLSIIRMATLIEGDITIGGTSIKQLSPFALRDNIRYLSQDLILYEDSIYVNIDPLGLYSIEVVSQKLRESGLWIFLEKYGLMLERIVDEKGKGISEGERQIVFLCRAYINQSKVLIFDEPFGNADYDLQESMLEMISRCFKNSTKIVITHHLNEQRRKYFDSYLLN